MAIEQVVSARLLNAQEELSTVHPEENQPEDEDDGAAGEERLVGLAEDLEDAFAQVPAQGIADKSLDRPAHAVDGDGVHADHDEREGPAAQSDHVDHQIQSGQDQEENGKGPPPEVKLAR